MDNPNAHGAWIHLVFKHYTNTTYNMGLKVIRFTEKVKSKTVSTINFEFYIIIVIIILTFWRKKNYASLLTCLNTTTFLTNELVYPY